MKNVYTTVLICFLTMFLNSYSFEKIDLDQLDKSNLYVNDGDSNTLHYLITTPKENPIGIIILLPSSGESTTDVAKQVEIPRLAQKKNIITIIPSINWGTVDREIENKLLNNIVLDVVKKYNIPTNNFVLGGLSNGGMVSLYFAEMAVKNTNSNLIKPKGVFGLDAPLDLAHLYEYCKREIERNYSEAGVNEAKWIISFYNKMFGGSPEDVPEVYEAHSIYSHDSESGGNTTYLKDVPVRMYTDLDIEWLINEKRRDLYDWNGTDITAMINKLKLMGNKDANVLITMGKGVRLNGTRHPHSWSIMDNEDCVNWVFKLFTE